MTNRPTLTEVAALAGVSVASTSRALTGKSASPKMVTKVQSAARQLGYVPDATARSLKLGSRFQLAFAIDDIGNPNYVEMMRAIEDVVRSSGFRLSILSTGSGPDDTASLVDNLGRGLADGLIISPLRISKSLVAQLENSRVPVAVIGSLPDRSNIDTVRVDSKAGIALAVRHLVACGHTRIGFVNGPLDTNPGTARAAGFVQAIAEAGIAPTADHTEVAEDFTFAAGEKAAQRLIARHLRSDGTCALTAVAAANDLLAIGTIHSIYASGLRVPEDLAVTGMDNTELARLYNPGITSVSLGSDWRGRQAALMVLDRLANPNRRPRSLAFEPELFVRASTTGGKA